MLFEEIQTALKGLRDVGMVDNFSVPAYITDNLKYPLYKWQRQALENFLFNEKKRETYNITIPNHLMFNMATGSGKTLVMAALILYYYKQGYRSFIFFVNQNSIVGKTQDNFINRNHPKYLFAENIKIDNRMVNIREVERFSESNDIQIKFTTIHKLHNDIYRESEDSLLLSDLQQRDVILLGDEAHHLNADTIRNQQTLLADENSSFESELTGRSSREDVERSWESTVRHRILNRKGAKTYRKNRNALLEFTATIPTNAAVQQNYEDKIITQFDIKDFIQAGCTKQIKLVRSNFDDRERILQALLLNWYRYRLALELELPNFKPVILFRNKTIDASKADYSAFLRLVLDLTPSHFDFLTNVGQRETSITDQTEQIPEQNKESGQIFDRIVAYMQKGGYSFTDVVGYIKANFGVRNCIITNSRTNTTKPEKTDVATDALLNSLESASNHIRAIFTVQRLTEGWDVLNLFDIVRLNHGRDTDYRRGRRGTSTTSEAQLIGRGIRYCPFRYKDEEIRRRKFDNDLTNKYRILEEFYFHSDGDERYISELSQELKQMKLLDDTRKLVKFSIKPDIHKHLKNTFLLVNERKENEERKQNSIPKNLDNRIFDYNIEQKYSEEQTVNLTLGGNTIHGGSRELQNTTHGAIAFSALEQWCSGYSRHIFYKAVHRLNSHSEAYFSFDNLRKRFNVQSLEAWYSFLGPMKINLLHNYSTIEEIPPKEWLRFTEEFLLFCKTELEKYDNPFIGTTEFTHKSFNECFAATKEKLIEKRMIEDSSALAARVQNYDWYAVDSFCGTDEERNLITFIQGNISNLKERYSKICLLRNEEVYKIFSFESGRGFCPDFLLLLSNKEGDEISYYQIFIEPKNKPLAESDRWKEQFLNEINERYGTTKVPNIDPNMKGDYYLIGLPFFNQAEPDMNNRFIKEFNKYL